MRYFDWLLWGDLCFQLFERTGGPGILGLYLQDNFRVSNFQINLLFTLIPMLMGTVMTPIISFQSDRTRTRWGRRIPYMAVTAPLLCLFAVVIGYSDDIINYLKTTLTDSSWISPMTAAILVIGFMVVGFTFFNEFVGTLYYYLFADVVPRPYMGRFMALFRVVGILTGFLINAFILPYQLSHIKAIHVAIAVIYFIGFGLMCWRVKEGEYPPVTDVTVKTTFFDKVKLYFRECFCHPIFILFYVMTGVGVLDKGMGVSGIFGLHLGQHQASAVADPKAVRSLAGTPDGRWCVTAGQDGQVKLWEKTGETQLVLRKTLPGADAPLYAAWG